MQRIIPILFAVLLWSSGCTPVAQVAPVAATADSTPLAVIVPTLTVTSTAFPTATFTLTNTPTVTPAPDPIRRTPPTLMLHRSNVQFDSVAFLKDFVEILKQNSMKVVTYRDIYKNPDITATERGKLFIITIDDINLAYPMDKRITDLIDVLQGTGYPAVLGIVTETDYADRGTVARLKELSDAGWEIASHTDHHANLGELEKASEKLVTKEVLPSLDKIEKAIGIRPITLILPEGQMINDSGIFYNMHLYWIVGINGGVTYDSRKKIIYVGREGPDKNAEYTFKIMKMRFGF